MIVFGFHAIQALLDEDKKIQSIQALKQADQLRVQKIKQQAQKKQIAWQEHSDRNRFEQAYISSGGDRDNIDSLQGIFAVADFSYTSLEEIFESTLAAKNGVMLFLDSITDPQNIGSILRSSAFFDVKGIVIPEDRSSPITSAAIKVSSGGAMFVPVARVKNLVRAIEMAKEKNIWVYGLSEHADSEITETNFDGPSALVIGNEEKGIRALVAKTCDSVLKLPAKGRLKSLNAAVATAVALALLKSSQ